MEHLGSPRRTVLIDWSAWAAPRGPSKAPMFDSLPKKRWRRLPGVTALFKLKAETDMNGDDDATMDCPKYLLMPTWTSANFT